MFRKAHRSSSGALNCICNIWFIYCNKVKDRLCIIYTKSFTLLQYINQRLQIQFTAPDDERCAARNMLSFGIINFGIINSITKLHLVGISTE
jgi:hypothetical protein